MSWNNFFTKYFSNKSSMMILLVLFLSCAKFQKENTQTPNIIFIFADDMTYCAIHALGNIEIKTPHLDQLVNQGTTFTHAYNMGAWNGAVCQASRAMIMSGRSVWNANKFRENWKSGNELDASWGKLIEQAGYNTYLTGKWHIDAKPENVFQNVVNVRSGMPKDAWNHSEMLNKFKALHGAEIKPSTIMPIGYNRPFNEQDTTWSPTNKSLGGYWEGGKHWSAVLKDDAINFINSAKENESPFFMYLAFNAPHDPRQAPKEYLDMYPLDSITLPKSWMPEYPFKDSIGNGQNLRDEALAPFPRTEFATKKHIQEYYALITHLDSQIGGILYALKQSGKGENTYVIFTADHGLAMGKHGLLGKQNLFDHSIRAPFIIAGPQIPKGKKISYDIYLQDAMATSLGLANIEKPNYVEFNSIMGLIRGKVKKSHYNGIYGAYIDLQRMIRKDNFKLIVYPKIEKILLFDLENDPEEMHDLFDDIKYKSRVNQLFLDLIQLQKKMNDPLNMTPIYNKLNKL